MDDPTPTPAAELRERIIRRLHSFDGLMLSFDAEADAILAEIQREWAIVPRVPTEAMLDAAADAFLQKINEPTLDSPMRPFEGWYRAMLRAAPPVTTTGGR